jgi:hypothetical protein
MPVVERELADAQIKAAAAVAATIIEPDERALAQVLVHCTEALVRQIRDHDDTQATVLAPALREGFADLTVVANEIGNRPVPTEHKRGLFS